MKKILLIVLAMLSLNTFAIVPKTPLKTINTETLKPVKFKAQRSFKDFAGSKTVTPAVKAPAKAPAEGTTSKFYMDCIEAITGIQYFCNLNHIYSEITTTPDNKAYISNIFYTTILGDDLYIEGTVDPDGSIEIGYQKLADYNGASLYIVSIDPMSGYADTEATFKLNYDKTSNVYYSDENAYFGVFVDYGEGLEKEPDTYCNILTYYPEDSFPEPTKYEYYFADKAGMPMDTWIDMIDLGGGYFYVNNMMPGHEDAWMLGSFYDGNIVLYSYQIATDNCAYAFLDREGYIEPDATLTYNSSTDSYDLDSSLMLGDVMYDNGKLSGNEPGLYIYFNLLTGLSICNTSTGISKTENSGKDAVSTEYFDLSGRRINNASKGISIMLQKYADGTSKAVKVMR